MKKEGFEKKSGFGFGESGVVVLAALVAEILFQVVLSLLPLSDGAFTWIAVVMNQAIFFGTVLFFARRKKVSFIEMTGIKRGFKLKYLPLLFLIALFSIAAFAPLAGLFSSLLQKFGYSYSPDYHVSFSSPGLFALAFLALSILPAIGEETLLRGALLSGAKEKSPLFAVLYSAAIFALFHGNAVQLVHQFLLGVVMAYLALTLRTILSSALIHFVNNGAALLLDYLYLKGSVGEKFYSYFTASFAGALSRSAFILCIVGSWAVLFLLLFLYTVVLKKDREKEGAFEFDPTFSQNKINAFLSYLAVLPVKDKEKSALPEDGEEKYPERFSMDAIYHAALISLLLVVLAAGIFSEVAK